MLELAALAGFGSGLIASGLVTYFNVRRLEAQMLDIRQALKASLQMQSKTDRRADELAQHVHNPDRGWQDDHLKTQVRDAETRVRQLDGNLLVSRWRGPGGGL